MMLVVENLVIKYGGLQVLWDVNFSVNKGEIVALVGANAAGKTSTLKAIAGLIKSMSGTIYFSESSITALPPYQIVERGICLIPEGRRLYPDMTVRENLELGAYGKHVWNERAKMLEYVYSVFPVLEERGKQLARTLSGGEQQMVAIARGLMSRPLLCMLDEPSLGLSPIMVRDLLRVIRELRERGTTILLVEQNIQQTLTIADRAYVLENGRIVLEGSGTQLLNNDHVREAYLGI